MTWQSRVVCGGFVLLGLAQAWLWIASRRSKRIWERNVSALATVTSRPVAEGYAGRAIINAVGLIVFGAVIFVTSALEHWYEAADERPPALVYDLGFWGLTPILVCVPASFAVSWAKWPQWLFPEHARPSERTV